MSPIDDPTRPVREEDAFDLIALDRYLRAQVPDLDGQPEVMQFPGGASNLTYLVRYAHRDLVLRRPPAGARAKTAHDVLREAGIQAALHESYPYVPAILARCDDAGVIGSDFYVMERLQGSILRRDLPPSLELDEADTRTLCLHFLDRLLDLHGVDVDRAGLRILDKGEGYIARQVSGWSDRYRLALTEGADACDDVVAWLARQQPSRDNAHVVIHNDYRFDNVVLAADDPLRIIGVLDWEMATIGDPLMDLGGSLAYWVQADDDPVMRGFRRQPTHAPGMLTRHQVVEYYGERSGLDVSRFGFYEVFGLFRLMVIIQQLYRRFALGQTTHPQFAGFGDAARYMAARCRRLMDRVA